MPKQIPIVGGFYNDPDRHWSRQDCLNWIPVKAERPGALTEWVLRDAPGLKPYMQIADDTGGIRGARNVEGKLFVVWRSTLYQISNTGIAIPRGTIPGIGRVSMAHNAKGLGNELLTVNGSAGYVYDTQTLAFGKVTDTGYPGAFVADFVDQYLAQVEPGGRYWFHSDLADAHAYNTLDQYQAEGDPDRIVSLLVSHREVLVFGKDTIEPYVNAPSGDGTAPFVRASNTVIECGCSARFTPRRMDNSAFWLDDNRLVRRLDGYTPIILATEAIAGAFAECTEAEVSQAYAFTWEGGGHKVYYITVPNRFTFGYDAKTGEWHRRASFGLPHWAVSDIVFWNGKWYACDSRRPRLFELDSSYKLDGCDPLVRERSAQVVWADQNEVTLDELELMFGTPSESSECSPFQTQPQGPTISGSAPDWNPATAGYAYQYSLVPGDAPIVNVAVVAGAIPAGMTLSASGELSGDPDADQTGPFSFTLRATDENGLWDDHADTIHVSDAIWWLMRAGVVSNELYASNHPATWPYALERSPVVISNTIGAFTLPDGNVVIPSATSSAEVVEDIMPNSGIVTTEAGTLAANVARIRRFGDIALAFLGSVSVNATTYYFKQGAGAWTAKTLGGALSGRNIYDANRLANGRWVAYAELGSSYDAIYSDDDGPPENWSIASGSHVPTPLNYGCPAVIGNTVLLLLNSGRVLRSTDGANYSTLTPALAHNLVDVRDVAVVDDTIVFVGQAGTGQHHITVTADLGESFSNKVMLTDAVERIDVLDGVLCASGYSPAYSEPNLSISSDKGATWYQATMPYITAGDERASAGVVRRR